MNPPTLDEANLAVTEAILEAERNPCDHTWQVVANCESQLADLLPGNTLEGALARSGAVQACIKGNRPTLAFALYTQYVTDPSVGESLRQRLFAHLLLSDMRP